MKITYVILLIFLCGYFLPTSGFSSPKQENAAEEQNARSQGDAIKARMLYRMAVWKWRYQAKKASEMPKLDSTSVDAFIMSVKKGDKDGNPAGINTLYNKIFNKLGKSYFSSSPEEVSNAIEETLKGKYPESADSEEFIHMLAYIHDLAKPSINPPTKDKESNHELITDSNSKNTDSIESERFSNPEPTETSSKLNFIELHPYLFSLGSLLLGFLLGGGLVWSVWESKLRYLNERISRRNDKIAILNYEIQTLKSEKTSLIIEKNSLTKETKNPNSKDSISGDRLPNSIEDSDQKSNPSYSSLPEQLPVKPELEPALKVEAAKKFYAPAAEDPYIEQSKMYLTHSGAAAVMLTIDPRNPDRAEFEFSPYADQDHIINTSITQLDQFFEYTLPSRGFSKIKNAGKGTLQLENGIWVRKTKARLELH